MQKSSLKRIKEEEEVENCLLTENKKSLLLFTPLEEEKEGAISSKKTWEVRNGCLARIIAISRRGPTLPKLCWDNNSKKKAACACPIFLQPEKSSRKKVIPRNVAFWGAKSFSCQKQLLLRWKSLGMVDIHLEILLLTNCQKCEELLAFFTIFNPGRTGNYSDCILTFLVSYPLPRSPFSIIIFSLQMEGENLLHISFLERGQNLGLHTKEERECLSSKKPEGWWERK